MGRRRKSSIYDLKVDLDKLDQTFKNSHDLYGKTLLTRGDAISGPRGLMFSNHLDQFVQVAEPEIPLYSTGYENIVGSYSDSYKQIEDDIIIIKKIVKFPEFNESPYILIIYNKDLNIYDIIERKPIENLTEHYCYRYDNKLIDSVKEGDEINKGTVIYKSKSFDDSMNYRYGVNALTLYWTDTRTTEDAIVVSESFAKKLISPESDTIRLQINDNDILINYYGNSNVVKSFPDIGESVKDNIICAARRKYNETVLFDLDDSRLNQINRASDQPYYGTGKIVDIMVYSNNQEYLKEESNAQIRKYYDINIRYYTEIFEELSKYVDKYPCSDDIFYLFDKARDIITQKEWRDKDKKFSNLVLEFKVVYESKIAKGSKITGRYGDKGVISEIVPDEDMPITENGLRVDVISNQCGVIGRLNPGQLIEQNLSFITMQILEEADKYESYDEKLQLITRYLSFVDHTLRDQLIELKQKDEEQLKNLLDEYSAIKSMNITQDPYYSEFNLDSFTILKNEFPFLRKFTVYNKVHGEYREMEKKCAVGFKYIIKLKHTPASKFSARSVSFVNNKGIPTKSTSYKVNKSLYSTSPVRIGEMEQSILSIGIGYDLVAKLNLEHSSSIMARERLNTSLYNHNIFSDVKINVDECENRNVEILSGYMKVLGIKFNFDEQPVDEIETYYSENFIMNPMEEVEVGFNKSFGSMVKIPEKFNPVRIIETK
ncbi:hypothetical protein DLH72_04600 [Candidatus Gracilibacteria bacterium]|nr:MAG: hypothetical protein DLH72_04600 [Candidatus Gracilibacteria bacterium]